jgi:hypothetical protein
MMGIPLPRRKSLQGCMAKYGTGCAEDQVFNRFIKPEDPFRA